MDLKRTSIVKGTKERDAAQLAFVEHFEGRDESWRQEQTKKLLRKVDLHLIPFLVVSPALPDCWSYGC